MGNAAVEESGHPDEGSASERGPESAGHPEGVPAVDKEPQGPRNPEGSAVDKGPQGARHPAGSASEREPEGAGHPEKGSAAERGPERAGHPEGIAAAEKGPEGPPSGGSCPFGYGRGGFPHRHPPHSGSPAPQGHSAHAVNPAPYGHGNPAASPAHVQPRNPAGSPAHGHPADMPHADPSVMHERFGKMPLSDPGLFTIKRLLSRSSPTDSPSPAIRTGVHCFVFVESGETLITIGTDTYLFKSNECAVIPAGQVFTVRYWHECTGFMGGFHTDFLNADCSGRSVLRTFPFLRKWGGHKVRFDTGQAHFIMNILHRLLGECGGGNNNDVLRTYLTALFVEIEQARAKGGREPDIDNRLCNEFVEFVFEHPGEGHSLAFHAERLNVSQPHLTRTVKNLTGKTPLQWINEAVILEAKVLLSHTDLPVGEIAERVGHGDPSYFTRMFRRHVRMAPLAYRAGAKITKN